MNPLFSKGFIVSLAGHLAAFSIFSFSFGKMPEFSSYNFSGSILSAGDLGRPLSGKALVPRGEVMSEYADARMNSAVAYESAQEESRILLAQAKPQVLLLNNAEKAGYLKPAAQFARAKEKPAIIFYPRLHQSFIVYFQDRQTVHIELEFNITSHKSINSIIVQRKVSSGNLEADLLSARYISRYLFIQQARFPLNSSQTVKIDLSTKPQQ